MQRCWPAWPSRLGSGELARPTQGGDPQRACPTQRASQHEAGGRRGLAQCTGLAQRRELAQHEAGAHHPLACSLAGWPVQPYPQPYVQPRMHALIRSPVGWPVWKMGRAQAPARQRGSESQDTERVGESELQAAAPAHQSDLDACTEKCRHKRVQPPHTKRPLHTLVAAAYQKQSPDSTAQGSVVGSYQKSVGSYQKVWEATKNKAPTQPGSVVGSLPPRQRPYRRRCRARTACRCRLRPAAGGLRAH